MNLIIGTNIKSLRREKNVTQEQLAEAMGVTCAAVSKWERGESYPDITLLQPLAYYFGVSLDELMGYNREKIDSEINEVIKLYRKYRSSNDGRAREIITEAYRNYPNDYRIMSYYMWNIGGDMADNDPAVLTAHKYEFFSICEKILDGCTDESIRLNAWNMRAKILHAEGKTDEALEIYKNKFTTWYGTCGQKTEQLFAKDTDEYYYHVRKNMYELAAFAGDKLGRKVFFDNSLSCKEKSERAVKVGAALLECAKETGEVILAVLAEGFLGRMRNDLSYRGGGEDCDVLPVLDADLASAKVISEAMTGDIPLRDAFWTNYQSLSGSKDFLSWIVDFHLDSKKGNDPAWLALLDKYR